LASAPFHRLAKGHCLVPKRRLILAAHSSLSLERDMIVHHKNGIKGTGSDGDPITRDADGLFHRLVPGAKGQLHTIIEGAGHFLQEDKGEQLACVVLDFFGN
jgi:hypothetical protein